jgi:hypothetical protein
MFSWPLFFGSLVTGLIGVFVSVVSTIAYNSYADRRRLKVDCTRQLFRYSISDDEFFRAFNEVPILFSRSPKVLLAHQRVVQAKSFTGEEIIEFVLAIATDMKMAAANREQLLQRFSSRK